MESSSQESSSQESSSQESSGQEPIKQETSSSAATDLEQLRTWSSHGPGAAADMEQLQSRTFKEGR